MGEINKTKIKFKIKLRNKSLSAHPLINKLIYWGKTFSQLGVMPANGAGQTLGNLSFRFKKGKNAFIITASGVKSDFILDAFVLVTSVNFKRKIVYAVGNRLPSSESMLHYAIYKQRKDVNAIFHGHSTQILKSAKKLKLPITRKEEPYGSIALVKQVIEILDNNCFVVMKRHGFLALGKDINQAGRLIDNLLLYPLPLAPSTSTLLGVEGLGEGGIFNVSG